MLRRDFLWIASCALATSASAAGTLIELVEQVFVKAGLDLQLGQAVVDGVVGFGWIHAPIGHELALHWR